MALARVVSFDGVSRDRMEEMNREMGEGDRPEGLDATEFIVLHDPEAEKSLVILFFETEDAYKRGDEMLNAMRHLHAGPAKRDKREDPIPTFERSP